MTRALQTPSKSSVRKDLHIEIEVTDKLLEAF